MYHVTYDTRIEQWSARVADYSSCQIHFHSYMLSPLQAPEGPNIPSHELNGARCSPEGADHKIGIVFDALTFAALDYGR